MASSLRLLAVMLLIMCAAFLASASTSATDDPSTVAARLLDHMEAGRFAEATSGFDDKMKAALDAEKLEQVQHQLEGAGMVQRRGPARLSKVFRTSVVTIRIVREAATLDAVVAIDTEGRVAGLHFLPEAEPES